MQYTGEKKNKASFISVEKAHARACVCVWCVCVCVCVRVVYACMVCMCGCGGCVCVWCVYARACAGCVCVCVCVHTYAYGCARVCFLNMYARAFGCACKHMQSITIAMILLFDQSFTCVVEFWINHGRGNTAIDSNDTVTTNSITLVNTL